MASVNGVTELPNPMGGFKLPEQRRGGLNFQTYQDLKSTIHRDLLNKSDVERVATLRDEHTRAQALAVIEELVSKLTTPLSGPEKERLSLAERRSRKCFGRRTQGT